MYKEAEPPPSAPDVLKTPKRRSWTAIALAVVLLTWTVSISGVFGNSGLLQAYRLSRVQRDLDLRVRALENDHVRLQTMAQALEKDPLVQEYAIRETLGFVRDKELVFEFQ